MQTFAPKTKAELGEMAIEKLNALTPDSKVKWSCEFTYNPDLGIHATQYLLSISFSSENAENEAKQKLDAVLEKLPANCQKIAKIKQSSEKLEFYKKTEYCHTVVIPLDDLISQDIFDLKKYVSQPPPSEPEEIQVNNLESPQQTEEKLTQKTYTKEEIKEKLLESQDSAKAILNKLDENTYGTILLEIQEELIAAQKQASEILDDAMFKKWIKELGNLGFDPIPTLQLSEKKLEEQMKNCPFSNEKKEEVFDIYHKYHAISFIKTRFLDSQTEGVGLRTVVDNLHQAGNKFETDRKYLEKERHPFIRKMLYKASLILLNVGIGIITSVICAVDSKLTFGTWDYLKAMDEMGKKHTGKFKTEKALKIAGIPLCDNKKTPGNHF